MRFLAVIVTAALTWWVVGWHLRSDQATESSQEEATSPTLSLRRTPSESSAPPKLSSQWLEAITQKISTLTPTELKVWDAKIKNWPPFTQGLVKQLLEERKAALGLLTHSYKTYSGIKRAAQSLVDRLRDESPEEMVATLEALDHRGEDLVPDTTLSRFFEQFAQEKPQLAAKAANLLRNQRSRELALNATVSVWATQDAQACLTWAETFVDVDDRALLGQAISGAVQASEEPLALIDLAPRLGAMGLGNPQELMQTARLAWAKQQPEEARTWLREPPDPALGNSFATALSRSNPEEATKHLDLVTDSLSLHHATTNIVNSWWNEDPMEALEWAKAQDSEIARVVAAESLAYKDAKQALQLLENAWDSDQDLGYFDRALANVAQHAPDLVFESTLLDQLDEIPGDVLRHLASKSPTRAIALMELYDTTANLRDIAEIWLEQDADAAGSWVSQLPRESLDTVASHFASTWAQKDRKAARAWVTGSLPKNSKAYEEALSRLEP